MIVWLLFTCGAYEGRRFELGVAEGQPVMLGRSPRSGFCFPEIDRNVSAAHAKLWLDKGVLYLTDVGSRYGTFVNGRAISKVRLGDGDRIQFGARGPEASVSFSEPLFLPAEGPTGPDGGVGNLTLSDVAVTISRGLILPRAGQQPTEVFAAGEGEAPAEAPVEAAPDPDALLDASPASAPDAAPAPAPVEDVEVVVDDGGEEWGEAAPLAPAAAAGGESGELDLGALDDTPPPAPSPVPHVPPSERPTLPYAPVRELAPAAEHESEPAAEAEPEPAAQPASPDSLTVSGAAAAFDPGAAASHFSLQLPSFKELLEQRKKKPPAGGCG